MRGERDTASVDTWLTKSKGSVHASVVRQKLQIRHAHRMCELEQNWREYQANLLVLYDANNRRRMSVILGRFSRKHAMRYISI